MHRAALRAFQAQRSTDRSSRCLDTSHPGRCLSPNTVNYCELHHFATKYVFQIVLGKSQYVLIFNDIHTMF